MSKYDAHISSAKTIEKLPNVAKGGAHHDFGQVQNYLRRYGYMAPDEGAEGILCDTTSVKLKDFQEFFHLKPSGEFDEETRRAMIAPRCGMPEPSPLAASTIGPWLHTDITFAFGNDTTQEVGSSAARDAVRRAFDTWGAVSVPLTFGEVSVDGDPDILVEWRPAADPDHSMEGGVLAHADFPPGHSIITDGRPLPLHFDDDEHTWVVGAQPRAFDIETVALHEIGHNLGILHTNVPNSVMFPSVRANFTLREPQPDDVTAIRRLYPSTIGATA